MSNALSDGLGEGTGEGLLFLSDLQSGGPSVSGYEAVSVPNYGGLDAKPILNKMAIRDGVDYLTQVTEDEVAAALLQGVQDKLDAVVAAVQASGSGGYNPLPILSLNAVSANTTGTPLTLTSPKMNGSMQVTAAVGVTSATVLLESTLNGTTWTTLDSWVLGTGPGQHQSGDMLFFTNALVMGVRATLTGYAGTGAVSATVAVG